MEKNSFIPFTIISSKLFRMEHELFPSNTSFIKKILLAIGIPRIDVPSYSAKIKDLYAKFEVIRDKTTEAEREAMSEFTEKDEFINKMDECIIAFSKVVESLERKLKNNKSLKFGEFEELINNYKEKKLDLLQVTEKIVTATRKTEEETWSNLHKSLEKWENEGDDKKGLDTREKNHVISKQTEDGLWKVLIKNDSEELVFKKAKKLVIERGSATPSFISRTLQIGQNQAARIFMRLQDERIISKDYPYEVLKSN
ncbi:MAG: DNA translocase FtsK [Candidatus Dojkabacteria bacterium]|nr:DNA translocase FtsK [Candidatus Dojkabacteria bacterium]